MRRGDGQPQIAVIPEGFFLMGSEHGQDNEQPCHQVWVDAFGIGKFPVTRREYGEFLMATQRTPPPFWSAPQFGDPEQPAVGVNWDDGIAYCRWLSAMAGQHYRLPTEAEWERAARGGREGTSYPWGDQPPWEKFFAGANREGSGPARVGINEPNGYGLFDMSEGVHEWCTDWYAYDYYRVSPERNPQGPASGWRRSSRGGSWRHRIQFSRCAARSSLPPSFRYADYGFRVALTLP
jgi:formylglycine-generating enzyme required for sulfatase activity